MRPQRPQQRCGTLRYPARRVETRCALRRMAIAAYCSCCTRTPKLRSAGEAVAGERGYTARGAPGDFARRWRATYSYFYGQTVVALAPPRQSGNFCSIPGLVRPDPHARVAALASGRLYGSNEPRKSG